jgi:hypothetical protein
MNDSKSIQPLIEEVEFILAERRDLSARGPVFRIRHRFHLAGTKCAPGEEIVGVVLAHRDSEYQLGLSLSQLFLFDYLARHTHLSQSARQIELGVRADQFYRRYAKNAGGGDAITRLLARSSIRVHVGRIRQALSRAFREAGIQLLDPCDVLVSQETVSNEVGYRFRAIIEWLHVDFSA